MGADVAVFWILALPAVVVFFLAFGVIEEIIQKRRASRKITEPRQPVPTPLNADMQPNADVPPAAHGYDTPELFRRDALIHIRELDGQVAEHEQNIQTILAEMKKRERHD